MCNVRFGLTPKDHDHGQRHAFTVTRLVLYYCERYMLRSQMLQGGHLCTAGHREHDPVVSPDTR